MFPFIYIFGVKIPMYGVMTALGYGASVWYCLKRKNALGLTREQILDIIFYIILGALIGRQDGSALNEVTKNVKLGDSGYSFMTNKDGVVISHRDIELVLNQYNPITEAKKDPSMQSLANAIRASQAAPIGSAKYTFNGREMVVGFAPIE